MANRNNLRGAIPYGEPRRLTRYVAGGSIAEGDLVTLDSSGRVVVASASTALLGAAACKASAADDVVVYDQPEQFFIMQCQTSEIDAQTDMNQNANIVATAALNGVSQHAIDGTSLGTTATLPLKLLKVEEQVGNALGQYVDVVVKINNHQLSGGTGTAGI